MVRSKLLAHAQLVRLPNVFAAMADPLAGWFVVGGFWLFVLVEF